MGEGVGHGQQWTGGTPPRGPEAVDLATAAAVHNGTVQRQGPGRGCHG